MGGGGVSQNSDCSSQFQEARRHSEPPLLILLIFPPELSSEFAPEFQSDSIERNETLEGNKKNQKGFLFQKPGLVTVLSFLTFQFVKEKEVCDSTG